MAEVHLLRLHSVVNNSTDQLTIILSYIEILSIYEKIKKIVLDDYITGNRIIAHLQGKNVFVVAKMFTRKKVCSKIWYIIVQAEKHIILHIINCVTYIRDFAVSLIKNSPDSKNN